MSQTLPKDIPQTLRRWKRYADYRDSCVEWLGEIPEHWETKKVKFVSSVFVPQRNKPELNLDSGLPWITMDDITSPSVDCSVQGYYVNELDGFTAGSKALPPGCVIASCVGNFGVASVNRVSVIINQQLQAYIPKKINSWFLRYLVEISKPYFEKVATATTLVYVNQERFGELPIVSPPIAEQKAIASFLDRETAKIDALIAKKERLIELLQEKRTAIISHTVTKGLDSTAPLKDSGVEWLGEIPEDWKVVTVRNLIRSECLEIQDGNHGEIHPCAEDYVEMGIPFLMANNIRNGKINLEGCKYISEQQAKSLRIGFSQSGDVLLTHKGTLGETSIIPHNIKFKFVMLTPQVTYYRIKKPELDKFFLYYYFQSKSFQERLKFIAGNQSTRDYVGLIAQKNFEIVLPYPYEQKVIASYLDRETTKIDALIAKIREGIEKLKEYRTALISAAVTGKIDVRNEVTS